MKAKRLETKRRAIIIITSVIVIITIVFAITAFLLDDGYMYQLSTLEDEIITNYTHEYATIISTYEKLADRYFYETLKNNEIVKLLTLANEADTKSKENIRNQLYKTSLDTFGQAKQDHFSQFNFILLDGTSFLRMDDIELHGDQANTLFSDKSVTKGFHITKDDSAYHYIYPIENNNQIVGHLDISLSYLTLTNIMDQLFDIHSSLIVSKDALNQINTVTKSESDYESLSFTNDYLLHLRSASKNAQSSIFYDLEEYDFIWDNSNILDEGQPIFLTISYDDIDYSVVLLNIDDMYGNHTAYLSFIEEDVYYYPLRLTVTYQYIALAILYLFAIAVTLILFISRYKIQKVGYFDKLTGAYNRNKLFDFTTLEMRKQDKSSFSIVIIDIDKFKHINDTYGHIVGDNVLKRLSSLILDNIRSTDMAFRYGGDEFILLFPNTNVQSAKTIADKIRKVVGNEKWVELQSPVTLSIGTCEYNGQENMEQLIARADSNLYIAKKQGKNQVVC